MSTANGNKLEGLSEKIFLDRYALKDADANNTKVGDFVLVLTKDDPKFPAKEVGEVIEREGKQVKVQLRNGDIVDSELSKLTLTKEKTPEELWGRLAKAMASVEAPDQQQLWEERFRYLLDDWKLLRDSITER
jgi:ribonucleoside-diphosphate reductase alpha chain